MVKGPVSMADVRERCEAADDYHKGAESARMGIGFLLEDLYHDFTHRDQLSAMKDGEALWWMLHDVFDVLNSSGVPLVK